MMINGFAMSLLNQKTTRKPQKLSQHLMLRMGSVACLSYTMCLDNAD